MTDLSYTNWDSMNDKALAERPQNSMNPVEMLCFIGTRGMGALEIEPPAIKENKRTFVLYDGIKK